MWCAVHDERRPPELRFCKTTPARACLLGNLCIVRGTLEAGDPSAITSPNEQDQRHYTRFLYYAVLDPATL